MNTELERIMREIEESGLAKIERGTLEDLGFRAVEGEPGYWIDEGGAYFATMNDDTELTFIASGETAFRDYLRH